MWKPGGLAKEGKELSLRSIPPHTITTKRPNGGVSGATYRARRVELRPRFSSRLRDNDILIPPRRSSAPSYEVVETATEYLVRVVFPGIVSLAELRWELTGDVLEVEYATPGSYYYENFLVPATSAPKVSVHDSVFEAQFAKVA
jgi:hypothetical protein